MLVEGGAKRVAGVPEASGTAGRGIRTIQKPAPTPHAGALLSPTPSRVQVGDGAGFADDLGRKTGTVGLFTGGLGERDGSLRFAHTIVSSQ